MNAVRLHACDGPAGLRLETIADPTPGPGQTLVKITCAALNRRDLFIAQGRYPNVRLPCTLGADGAGSIAQLGPGVTGPPVGTPVVIDPQLNWSDDPHEMHAFGGGRILGMPDDGTFANYVVVPAQNVYRRPLHLTVEEAAALPLAALTAYRAVFTRGQISAHDTVLITGVGSGVQTFALLFAKHAGARVIVTSGSDEKLERARALGADAGVNYKRTPDWHKAVRAVCGNDGPTLIIDSSGGETLARAIDLAAPSARIVIYGGTTGDATIRPYAIFWKHLTILGTSMGSPADFRAMLQLFENGLRPVIDRIFPLEEAAAAMQRLADSAQFGKVVLTVSPA
ncbi:MAG TPA: zinc-binding dehydrogenase [Candidatus Acidoferrales bacterium]|nr:zinc-binding dehydrogenase [Candidatus Acidoferrales bacterium]